MVISRLILPVTIPHNFEGFSIIIVGALLERFDKNLYHGVLRYNRITFFIGFAPDFIFFALHCLPVVAKLSATRGAPPEAQVSANLGGADGGHRVGFARSDAATVKRGDEPVLADLLDQVKVTVRQRLWRLNRGTFPHCVLLLSIGTDSPDQVPRTAKPKPSARSRSLSLMHCIHIALIHCLIAASLSLFPLLSSERNSTVPAGARPRERLGFPSIRSQP